MLHTESGVFCLFLFSFMIVADFSKRLWNFKTLPPPTFWETKQLIPFQASNPCKAVGGIKEKNSKAKRKEEEELQTVLKEL